MIQGDLHVLFQRMDEVLNGIRGIHDVIDIRQAQAEQLYEILRSDLSILSRDQHDLEGKLDCMAFVAQHDIEKIRSSNTDHARSIQVLVSTVDALKQPIDELVALKSRVAGILFAVGLFGSGALWLAEPVYRWFINTKLEN